MSQEKDKAEIERLTANIASDQQRLLHYEAEIKRLTAIEKAARLAHEYHLRGYRLNPEFDANTQLDLMNALGRALEENQSKPDAGDVGSGEETAKLE
jgi:hypothetical protein